MQLVRQELQAKLGDKVKDLSGVKIFHYLDSVAQDAAEKAAVEGIPALKKQRKLSDLETAIVVVDRFSGEVRAIVRGCSSRSLRATTVRCRRVVRLVPLQNQRLI
ncbi:hypothetical protein ACLK2A_00815 [Escherichia coli]